MVDKIIKLGKRMRLLINEYKAFGVFISLTNFFWPLINKLPYNVGRVIMQEKHNIIISYLHKNGKTVIEHYKAIPCKISNIPTKIIWVCWLQGENALSETTKVCFDKIKKFRGDATVNLITDSNINDYINLPSHIIKKHKMGYINKANFVDILRTFLLAEYGGLWIDITVLVTKKLENEIFNMPFYSIKNNNKGLYITKNEWSNFFLYSQKDSIIFCYLKDFFTTYLKNNDRFIDYFMMDYIIRIGYDNIPSIKKLIDEVPINNIHVHSLSKILYSHNKSNISISDFLANTHLFKLTWKRNILFENNHEWNKIKLL